MAAPSSQPLYNEGHVRFPSPNYNQNPSPFQLPTGRSQSGAQYYVNQPDYSPPQRQRFRPYNFQLVHPVSTKRPDTSQIHSVAYQNDPSKPETFLGQITINNPDIDYLQNNRFKNIPFDGNSLKSNGQSGHITHDEEFDNDNQDLYDVHRVTTYNPNKLVHKQRLNIKPNNLRFSQFESPSEDNIKSQNTPNKPLGININGKSKPATSSNENKALLELEPLLEDDISNISSFRELMKNQQESFDVQVIKSNSSSESAEDSKPDASSMNTDNLVTPAKVPVLSASTPTVSTTTKITTVKDTESHSLEDETQSEELGDDEEYVYYDETESPEEQHTTPEPESTEHATDIYDEYDEPTEEPEKDVDEPISNVTDTFDVLMMKPNKTMVKDDNFKHFVDTTVIDQTEHISSNETASAGSTNTSVSNEDVTSIETPSILRQEVVSVVTTKSVVNGTISIPDVTFAPSTTKIGITSKLPSKEIEDNDTSIPMTTENWIVVASVQTSRSVSGARFLPFPTLEQEDKKQVITDEEEEEDEEMVTKDPLHDENGDLNSSSSSSSTENINDKLDSIQSELSSAVLSGSLNNDNKNIELITESTTEQTTTTTTTTTTTPSSLNIFTLKSTLPPPPSTERSAPEPPPVLIKKFTPRVTTSTTPRPRKKPSLVTVMDDLSPGLLPSGYKPRLSYKDKRTSTTTTTTTTSTTTTTTSAPVSSSEDTNINGTQGRSSGINSKNRVILLDDKSLLPKEYKPKERPQEDLLKKFQKDDISQLLPPGYKPPVSDESEVKLTVKPELFDKIQTVDISAFLPKGFTTEKPKDEPKLPIKAIPVDISAFLPPGFKLNTTEPENSSSIINKFKIADVSNFLPPGLKQNNTEEESTPPSLTTKAPGGIKLRFPTRPGSKPIRKTTTSKSNVSVGPEPVTPKIQKGWPTR